MRLILSHEVTFLDVKKYNACHWEENTVCQQLELGCKKGVMNINLQEIGIKGKLQFGKCCPRYDVKNT